MWKKLYWSRWRINIAGYAPFLILLKAARMFSERLVFIFCIKVSAVSQVSNLHVCCCVGSSPGTGWGRWCSEGHLLAYSGWHGLRGHRNYSRRQEDLWWYTRTTAGDSPRDSLLETQQQVLILKIISQNESVTLRILTHVCVVVDPCHTSRTARLSSVLWGILCLSKICSFFLSTSRAAIKASPRTSFFNDTKIRSQNKRGVRTSTLHNCYLITADDFLSVHVLNIAVSSWSSANVYTLLLHWDCVTTRPKESFPSSSLTHFHICCLPSVKCWILVIQLNKKQMFQKSSVIDPSKMKVWHESV